jgi:hypothetical protein
MKTLLPVRAALRLFCLFTAAPVLAAGTNASLTLYATTVENQTSGFSAEFYLVQQPSLRTLGLSPAGSVYYQEAELHLSDQNGPVVGTLTSSCTLMPSGATVQCASTFRFRDGAVKVNGAVVPNSAFNTQGAYTEILGPVNGQCQSSVNQLAVTGGTEAFRGVQGQAMITHTPGNADPLTCEHTIHPFRFDFTLLLPSNQQPSVAPL